LGLRLEGKAKWIKFAGAEEISGFLELLGGTQLAARRHTRDEWCSNSRKNIVFRIFCGIGTVWR